MGDVSGIEREREIQRKNAFRSKRSMGGTGVYMENGDSPDDVEEQKRRERDRPDIKEQLRHRSRRCRALISY